MKKIAVAAVMISCATMSYATESRIIGLGKHDNFFRDDYSVFRNPANANLYPNMIIGSGGIFTEQEEESNNQSSNNNNDLAALKRKNRDPIRQYGGGILSYSLAKPSKEDKKNEKMMQYPMFSVGVALNRYDKYLDYFIKGEKEFEKIAGSSDSIYMPEPVGKIDLLGSYAFPSGTMIGGGAYIVNNNAGIGSPSGARLRYIRGNVGVNTPLATSTSLEASLGITAVDAMYTDTVTSGTGTTLEDKTLASFSDSSDFIADLSVRLFSDLVVLNGKFVPRLGVTYFDLADYTKLGINIGMGANLNIDRGFGWAGVEILYDDEEGGIIGNDIRKTMGTRLSFGLERNIIWNWFLFRAGVSKTFKYVKQGEDGTWTENVEADGTKNDFLGIGIGANVENRLKIDCIVAEDNCFTLTNFVSGPQHHFFTRFGVTYSF